MTATDLFGDGLHEMSLDSLFFFPAWELKRIFQTNDPEIDWPLRFQQSGGQLVCGRMVALKTDAVWKKLITEDVFKTARDTGMFWVPVPREDCIALGLMSADESPGKNFKPFVIDGKIYTEDALRELEKKLRGNVKIEK